MSNSDIPLQSSLNTEIAQYCCNEDPSVRHHCLYTLNNQTPSQRCTTVVSDGKPLFHNQKSSSIPVMRRMTFSAWRGSTSRILRRHRNLETFLFVFLLIWVSCQLLLVALHVKTSQPCFTCLAGLPIYTVNSAPLAALPLYHENSDHPSSLCDFRTDGEGHRPASSWLCERGFRLHVQDVFFMVVDKHMLYSFSWHRCMTPHHINTPRHSVYITLWRVECGE